MQERRDAGQERYRTEKIQYKKWRTGGIQEWRDSGQEGFRTGGMQDR